MKEFFRWRTRRQGKENSCIWGVHTGKSGAEMVTEVWLVMCREVMVVTLNLNLLGCEGTRLLLWCGRRRAP